MQPRAAFKPLQTGGTWAPIWVRFAHKWAERPHLGSRTLLPTCTPCSSGTCSPRQWCCALAALPGEETPARVMQRLHGSVGLLASVPGERELLPWGEEKKS